MADRNVEVAIAHWAPRMIQNGVDYNDFVRTTARIETWAEWLPEWNRTADEHAELAVRTEAEGHLLTAGHAWRRASVDRHFGKFVWQLDLDLVDEATRRSVEEMQHAHRLLDPTAERLVVDVDGHPLAANLRRPPGVDRPPWVAVIPGLDSTKEEFFYFEQSFLDRGRGDRVGRRSRARARPDWTAPDAGCRSGPTTRPGWPRCSTWCARVPISTTTGSAWSASASAATTRPGWRRTSRGCARWPASAARSASATCGTTCRR